MMFDMNNKKKGDKLGNTAGNTMDNIYLYITMLKYPALYIFFSLIIALIANFVTRSSGNTGSQYAIVINTTAVIITFRYILKNFKDTAEVKSTFKAFKNFKLYHLAAGSLCALLCVIFIDTILYLLDHYAIFPRQFFIYKQNVLSLFSGNIGIIEILMLSALIPLFEEFLFRGLLFTKLQNNFTTRTALIVQVIIFGLIHGLPIQIVYGLFIGVIFTLLYIFTDSLWTASICHMIFNGLNLLQYFINENSPSKIIETFCLQYSTIILSITPALLIVLLIYLRSQKKTTPI